MNAHRSRPAGRGAVWVAVVLATIALILGTVTVVVQADEDGEPNAREALLAKADTIAAKVSKLRGLKIQQPIKRGVMNKAQIRKRVVERMDEEYEPAELAAEELSMKRMGLLPAGADYKTLVIDLLTDEIAGFYDPWERQLYIAGWQPASAGLDDGVMAHEIDHALQDQHFDLRKFMKAVEDDADASAARQALVEGDGMALMVEFMMPGGASPWSDDRLLRMMNGNVAANMGSSSLATAPLILREALIFPYTKGLAFVAYFRKHHSWKRIDRIYKKPPLATEHILHPTKYETYERPDRVTPAVPAALAGTTAVYDNVSGEMGLAIWMRQHGVHDARAATAAEGWGGDRLVIYAADGEKDPKKAVAVQYAVWDHEADAIEFFEAAVDALSSMSGGGETSRSDTAVAFSRAGAAYSIERRGDAVVIVVGAAKDDAGDLMKQVWSGWKVKRR